MNITLFNKKYWIRRFGEQRVVRGYVTSDWSEFVASIHVHPGSSQQTALPEGERRLKRLEGHGNIELYPADQTANRKGDLLFYHGEWYECVSCVMFDHTYLSHWNYQFTQVPADVKNPDIQNEPAESPEMWVPKDGGDTG